MASSLGSTKDIECSPSLRSLSSVKEDSQIVLNGHSREDEDRPSGCAGTSRLVPHTTSLVSRKASFATNDSYKNQGGHFPKDQAQMFKHIISIISFMRSRASSSETDNKKAKVDESESSGKTDIDHIIDNYDDSDEIPWFGATEAEILASRAASSAPSGPKESETEEEDVTDDRSDDYVAFQSSIKRRRLLSMFDRQEKMADSTTLDSFDEEAQEMDMSDLYQLFTLLEASGKTSPSLRRRMNRRMPKFGISTSSRSLFKRH